MSSECNVFNMDWVPCECGNEYCNMQKCFDCDDILAKDCNL